MVVSDATPGAADTPPGHGTNPEPEGPRCRQDQYGGPAAGLNPSAVAARPGRDSQPAALNRAQVPPRTRRSDFASGTARRPSGKKPWVISAVTALAVLALGVILLLRPVKPGGDPVSPAPAAGPDRRVSQRNRPGPRLKHPIRTVEDQIPRPTTPRSRPPPGHRRRGEGIRRVEPNSPFPAGTETATARAGLYLPGGWRAERIAEADRSRLEGEDRGHRQPRQRARRGTQLRLCRGFHRGQRPGRTSSAMSARSMPSAPWTTSKKNIDAWVQFYPQIRGFFFDQQPEKAVTWRFPARFAITCNRNGVIPW